MLIVHRADRADDLAEALGAMLAAPLADPMAAEVLSVPTRGMERWLTQRLSTRLGASDGHQDGVCANVRLPFPHRLVAGAVAAASGVDPEQDSWRPEHAAWALLEVVEECLGERWLGALAAYLGAGPAPDPVRRTRRLTTMRHLADLFDAYALHRPRMMRAWVQESDLDELGEELPPEARWQAELWRRLRLRIGLPGPAERREHACRRIAEEPAVLELPPRLGLFGLTRLPAGHLEVLEAIARERDVHLFLLHPSPALWERVRDHGRPPTMRREQDPTMTLPRHPLLASWGRDSREMQLVLAAAGAASTGQDEDHGTEHPAPRTLLARIQTDIRADRAPPGVPAPGAQDQRAPLADDDRSLQVHACHGRQRQVEVLRDAILHALADDPSLEPRDVIVMCPDVESFAPLVQATFGPPETTGAETAGAQGAGETAARTEAEIAAPGDGETATPGEGETATPATPAAGGGRIDLRVRLADRALAQTNPVLGVVGTLLALVDGRLTASEVLDLADRAPVRRRFELGDEDLARLQDWVVEAGIRWGLDAEHRAPYRLAGLQAGTWRAGLDRLLLGVAMSEERQRLFASVLPLDDVDSASIDLAGRVAELLARLGEALDSFSTPQPLAAWAEAIAAAADALTDTPPRERWQRAELARVLEDLVSEAGARAAGEAAAPLSAAEIRAHLAERLGGRPTRANFRTGHLTVCTLMPMRSVPHRVVCLLGLDDGAFPRKALRDGDDLMLEDPLIGERDPRSEDRQLLLDALMAAQERLIVTYTGNDERTNVPRPPAVPVGELLDTAQATMLVPGGGDVRERIVVRHPLQPFDPRNFCPGELAEGGWSFDRVNLQGARALINARRPAAPFVGAPLPPRREPVVELDDLVAFIGHPVRGFLRQRLGISLWERSDEVQDRLSIELDGLERWGVGQRLLEARLAGVDGRAASLAEIARGTLPPGVLGKPLIEHVYRMTDAIVNEIRRLVGDAPVADPVDVRVALPGARRLSGTVAGVRAGVPLVAGVRAEVPLVAGVRAGVPQVAGAPEAGGDVLLAATFSRVGPRHRLAAWVRLLALSAAHPERAFAAATVGRGQGDDVRVAYLPPLGPDEPTRAAAATELLADLVELRDRGLREPLPLFCQTSEAWATAASAGRDPVEPATKEWTTTWAAFAREDSDPGHRLAFGERVPLERLLERPPAPDEEGRGWPVDEPTRLGRLARRLWDPLLAREELSAR